MRALPFLALCVGLAGLGGLPEPAAAQDATVIGSGTFAPVGPRYQGGGTAQLIEVNGALRVQLDDSFTVTAGPDLEVWLVDGGVPTASGQVLEQEYVSLGALRSPTGAQAYEVPEGVDVSDYDAVIIWCEDFSVLFTVAPLS